MGKVLINRHCVRLGVALLCCLVALAPAVAQTRQLLNYQEIHKPLVAERGMVVSQSDQASRIGAQILRDGGNAVDAAVAVAFAMAVTLPRAGNIGGDGYMLVHLADGRAVAIDFRSMAPALAKLETYVGKDGKLDGSQSAGIRSAGVPGTVAGMALAHERYGRLPWKRLLQPAIELAGEGMVLSRDEAFALEWGKGATGAQLGRRARVPACGRVGPACRRTTGAIRPGLEPGPDRGARCRCVLSRRDRRSRGCGHARQRRAAAQA